MKFLSIFLIGILAISLVGLFNFNYDVFGSHTCDQNALPHLSSTIINPEECQDLDSNEQLEQEINTKQGLWVKYGFDVQVQTGDRWYSQTENNDKIIEDFLIQGIL